MRMSVISGAVAAACTAVLLFGCSSSYSWRSTVPVEVRTVAVPTFRNETNVTEAGPIASRQLLREIQREGTFAIRSQGNAAIEIQGVVKKAAGGVTGYDRRHGLRISAYELKVTCLITVVDKRRGALLLENVPFEGETTFTSGQDVSNAQRDAIGRALDDVARKVVDRLLTLNYKVEEE